MELKGAQDSFAFLKAAGLKIHVFISDRHRSIAKWIREHEPATRHFFDIWHVAKSVTKKLLQVGKESGCELLVKWQKAIKNHLHWCATSTKLGFGELILAKWKSIIGMFVINILNTLSLCLNSVSMDLYQDDIG